jgi:hypothetical protein
MKKRSLLLIIALLSILSACKEKEPTMVGGDKGAHGCIPSAGYQWCGKENKCVRSWELANEKKF